MVAGHIIGNSTTRTSKILLFKTATDIFMCECVCEFGGVIFRDVALKGVFKGEEQEIPNPIKNND